MRYRCVRACTDYSHRYHGRGDIVDFDEGEKVPPHFAPIHDYTDVEKMDINELRSFSENTFGIRLHHRLSEESARERIMSLLEKRE